MPRMNLTARERELVEAFRTERNIYNGALADAVFAIKNATYNAEDPSGSFVHNAALAVLALRKED